MTLTDWEGYPGVFWRKLVHKLPRFGQILAIFWVWSTEWVITKSFGVNNSMFMLSFDIFSTNIWIHYSPESLSITFKTCPFISIVWNFQFCNFHNIEPYKLFSGIGLDHNAFHSVWFFTVIIIIVNDLLSRFLVTKNTADIYYYDPWIYLWINEVMFWW